MTLGQPLSEENSEAKIMEKEGVENCCAFPMNGVNENGEELG